MAITKPSLSPRTTTVHSAVTASHESRSAPAASALTAPATAANLSAASHW